MAAEHPGHLALKALDEVLRERPNRDGHAFTVTTENLARFRDIMIERRADASPADRQRLERVNAVLTVVIGGHFPLGSIPWPEIEKARDWLAAIVRETEGSWASRLWPFA